MRHQALQLVAGELVKRTLRDGHNGVVFIPAAGKGIDAFFALQHHGRGGFHAGGNRQFLDDVAELLFGLMQPGSGFACAHAARQLFATAVEGGGFQPPAAQHQQECHPGVDVKKIRGITVTAKRDQTPGQCKRQVDGHHQPQHREQEQHQQAPCLGASLLLLLKKPHARAKALYGGFHARSRSGWPATSQMAQS